MTREKARIRLISKREELMRKYMFEEAEVLTVAIEALKAQEFDEVVFDTNDFFSIVDDGKITVMRRGKGKVTVERPAIRMETTICSYGERRE